MAWNQPGGQNSNPWGRRPGGSPLDAQLKEWQRRLTTLFRGGRSGGGEGEGGGRDSTLPIAIVVLLLVAGWLATGFFQVDAAERGVIQRFGRLIAVTPQGAGWHWPWPIETLTKLNVQSVRSGDYKSRVLTADESLVDLHLAVQYRYSDPIKVLFRVRQPEDTLKEVSESALRQIVGRSTLDEVLVGATRREATRRSQELIQRTLDFYNCGLTVTSVNLTEVQVPEPVMPAQRDANKALAEEERSIKEAQTYANDIIPVARGTAARMQQEAEGYKAKTLALAEGEAARFNLIADAYAQAPDVTRKRLYLETMEEVLGRAHKVIVDGKAVGNLLSLPLDKLMGQRAAAHAPEPQGEPTVRVTPDDPETATDPRSRGER